jgi:hypothetical protein
VAVCTRRPSPIRHGGRRRLFQRFTNRMKFLAKEDVLPSPANCASVRSCFPAPPQEPGCRPSPSRRPKPLLVNPRRFRFRLPKPRLPGFPFERPSRFLWRVALPVPRWEPVMIKPLASLLSTPHSSTLKKKIFDNVFFATDLGTKRMTAPTKIGRHRRTFIPR